jgi:dipeptidyl aminopeptidase/acylaminoacyl peptidase
MDKIWWNEQWMGPIGPHYAEQSNITNAYRLKGKLLLMVGELDTNVPPETTYRLCDALIKANKDFSFLVLPGSDHTSGGTFGERKRRDFFVKNLLGVDPPNWNEME